MILRFGDIYGSKVVILEEDTNVEVGLKETRDLTGGWLEEFSEPWSEACPCQTQGSRRDELFKMHSPLHLLVLNFHNWP